MLAVNVQESTTTTGTGDITLAGASEDGRTFTSQFDTDEPLYYYIDDRAGNWEFGIGHLSGASTLVRESLTDSSTGSLINFGAGTKQVFNGYPSASVVKPKLQSGRRIISPHIVDPDNNSNLSIERQIYLPFIVEQETTFDSLGASVSLASSTGVFHLGLYTSSAELYPENRIVNASGNSSTSSGIVNVAITPTKLKAGIYWVAIWNGESSSFRSYSITSAYNVGIGVSGSNLFNPSGFLLTGQVGLSELPVTAPLSMGHNTGSTPTIFMDVE